MLVFRNLVARGVYWFGKKVINMAPVKITDPNSNINSTQPPPSSSLSPSSTPSHKPILDWQSMPFDQLCALSPQQLQQIELQIKKTKMNVDEQFFTSPKNITNPQKQLAPYWIDIFHMFCNSTPIAQAKLDRINRNAYLAKITLDQPETQEELLRVVQEFVNNMHDVRRLEGIAQPTFCKYLLGLKRDLKMQGLNIQSYVESTPKKVQIKKILSYQYQFWMDVKHNRSKNGSEKQFLTIKKSVQNPNKTIILTEQFPNIDITFIKRKKKRQDIQMNYVIKMLVEIEVEGKTHVVKVERKGPSSAKEETQLRNLYIVIDYDGVFKGNPTIRPIFQF